MCQVLSLGETLIVVKYVLAREIERDLSTQHFVKVFGTQQVETFLRMNVKILVEMLVFDQSHLRFNK